MAKKIVLFFGPPGSGKGTQSDMLGEKLKLPVISPGELLRHEIEKKTAIGKKAAAKMAKGELLDDQLVESIIEKRLADKDCQKGYILDGFPRRIEQLEWLGKKLLDLKHKEKAKIISFYIKVSDREVKERISGRRVCDCGAAYHLKYNPPKKKGICDLCGHKLEQRADDKPAVIKDRLRTYHELSSPILEHFQSRHLLEVIDGEQDIEVIRRQIFEIVKRFGK